MPHHNLKEVLSLPAHLWPALLEGRWLDNGSEACWLGVNPAEILGGTGDALCDLPAWLAANSQRFPDGAAIGFLSYELVRHFEPLQLATSPSLPDFSFAYYPQIESVHFAPAPTPAPRNLLQVDCEVDYETYERRVEKIRSLIAAGDIYQANLTVPFSAELRGDDPENIYLRLRTGGAPFRAFIKTPGRTILSNSPERFFRVEGNRILTSPIKGTIKRDPGDGHSSIAALLASGKDRAENLMIVDLLRNDLGRICDYASIQARLWDTEVLPQLVHLVSHVEGALRPHTGIIDILRALFPCGSITGAPKIRAMEILAELEGAPRGISMGALGIIRGTPASDRCRMDFNVAIRTMVVEDGKARFNAGGGIVYDSKPAAEYAEVMLKAQPLRAALGDAKKQTRSNVEL